MNLKYTDDFLIESARRFSLLADWRKNEKRHYEQAVRRGLIGKIKEFLVVQTTGAKKTYTEQELTEISRRFRTRSEWESFGRLEMQSGKVSSYNCALILGHEFFRKHAPHLVQRHTWTEDELAEAAAHYKHKGDWKRSDNPQHAAAYQSALNRPDVFERVTAHMTLKANPYAGTYVVYAFEFADRHAYVGITFRPDARLAEHMSRGPVAEHALTCGEYVHKHVERGLASPDDAAEKERAWIERYRSEGWAVLNVSNGGGLGTVKRKEWTKEIVISEALKYATRQAWIDGSQWSYRLAKREGWFAEAAAHMPRRVLGIGVGRKVSASTRAKQSAAKTGVLQSSATRQARSEALKRWWASRRKP